MNKRIKKRDLKLPNMQVRRKEAKVEAASVDGSTTYYVHGPQGIHAQQAEGEWKWMMQDGLDSVRSVVDQAVAVQESLGYAPDGTPIGGVGLSQTMYGFTGEPTDPNGLVHLRERYYNPDLGAFISQDPSEGIVEIPMSLNLYSYVLGNPVNMTDPSGMSPILGLMGTPGVSYERSYIPGSRLYDPIAMLDWVNAINHGCYDKPISGQLPRLQSQQSVSGLCEQISDPSLYYQCRAFPTAFFQKPIVNGDCTPDSPGFDDRWSTGLHSRDINPSGIPPNNYPVVSPARAEVMIVSTTNINTINTSGNNANLGNFVAIRIHTSDIPEGILQLIPVISGPGFIYMGFAHLDSVAVSVSQLLLPGDTIGTSGNTGLRPTSLPNDSISNAHLDLTMFFVPHDGSGRDPEPGLFGSGGSGDYNNFYRISRQLEFYPPGTSLPLEVDPAAVWGDQMPTCQR